MSHWLIGEPGWREVADLCLAWLAEHASLAAAEARPPRSSAQLHP